MYDISIIGGGPGGYVSAIRAAQLGAKVALFESSHVGGTCLNWGCIPTKSLLNNAHNWYQIKSKDIFTSSVSDIKLDISKLVQESRRAVNQLTSGVQYLLKNNNIDVFKEHASIVKPGLIKSKSHNIASKNIILATGADSRSHPILKTDGNKILNAAHAMTLTKIPENITIVGAGAIGVEFASFFNAIGSRVHLIEFNDNILSFMDTDVIAFMENSFSSRDIQIIKNCSVEQYQNTKSGISLTLSNKTTIEADVCLVCIGLTGNIHDLGLQNTKVRVNKNMQIITDEFSRTDEKTIYAIGDVAHNGPWLAHRASDEGIKCVEHILGLNPSPIVLSKVPGCVYSMPQIGSIGLTEHEATKQGYNFRIGHFDLSGNGKAIVKHDKGFVKLIIDNNIGTILGAHIVSNEATEIISQLGIMIDLEGTCDELNYIFPHPTISEAIPEAILSAYHKAIHMNNKSIHT